MSEATYYKDANVVDVTAGAAITSGQIDKLLNQCAVAISDVASGKVDSRSVLGCVKGVFTAVAQIANAGDPVWFDASASTFTIMPQSAAGDCFAGILAAGMAASAVEGQVLLNVRPADIPIDALIGKAYELKTDNYTVDAQDTGKVLCLATDAKTFTLPATAAGLDVILVNLASNGGALMSVSPNASDKIMGPDVAGVDDKDYLNTKATQVRWDYLHLLADGNAGWYVKGQRGTWAQES
jgi:predicted RecA/RadA family phage recombinase